MLEGKLFLLAGLARKKWHALFSSLQDSYCVNKVLLIPSGWLCRKTILAKLLVWVKVILLKTTHNCFSLLSWMLSTGNSAKFEPGLGVLRWQDKLAKGKEFSKCRGNLTWRFFEPASVFLTLLWREWKTWENQTRWEFNGSYFFSRSPSPGAAPEGSSPPQQGLLTLLSSKGWRQAPGSWHWKRAWGQPDWEGGGAALHPWRNPSRNAALENTGWSTTPKEKESTQGTSELENQAWGAVLDVSFPSRGRDGTSQCPQIHQEMLSVLFHILHQVYQQLCPRLFCTSGVKPKTLNNLPGICFPVPPIFPFPHLVDTFSVL